MPLRRAVQLSQSALLVVVPHGGQRGARSNAWAAMTADAQRSRAHREADAALAAAQSARAHERRVGG
jgi:hypothetical protein